MPPEGRLWPRFTRGVERHRAPKELETARSVSLAEARKTPMRTKKPAGLASRSGLLQLGGHAAMGVAMGLGFALILTLIDPAGMGRNARPDASALGIAEPDTARRPRRRRYRW